MPSIRLLPFRTPSPESVDVQIDLVSPTTDPALLPDAWDPTIDLEVQATATAMPSFYRETGLGQDAELSLVLTAECGPTRMMWSARDRFTRDGDLSSTRTALVVPGSDIAGSLELSASIIGDGMTGDPRPERARHYGARLHSTPVRILPLDRPNRFPTSVVSFSELRWRPIPWTVKTEAGIEAHAHLSTAIRLYLNSDLEEGRALAAATASEQMMSIVEADILMALFEQLARSGFRGGGEPDREEGDEAPMTLIDVAQHNAQGRLGISLDRALALVAEEPDALRDLIRERTGFAREGRS